MKKYTQGFTLIELLVVIAIIGILSSVVLVSLNSARNKGKESRVIASVQQIRTLAETAYNGSDYLGILSSANTVTTNGAGISATDPAAIQLVADVASQGGRIFAITNTGATQYAIFGSLVASTSNTAYFCISSNGSTQPASGTSTPTISCR